ncbi:unnamed protein product [Phyllotreta striolata]|uniref:EF-hand domain-containing protein n=1 Tax=Phyllotreta striolata TaxID=444603 RepID=A0A9N9XMW3_PHYSR|nr:unnamed protein product [Phyllotreta striolata]
MDPLRRSVTVNFEEFVEGKFTEARVLAIKEIFKKYKIKTKKSKDSVEPDRMHTADLGSLMRQLNFNPLKAEIEAMMNDIDPFKEGTITFYQFLYLLWHKTQTGEEDDILKAFKIFDVKGKGTVSLETLKKLLMKVGEPFNEEEMESFAARADLKGNGIIHYEDFINRMSMEEYDETAANIQLDEESEEEEEENVEEGG